MKHLIILRFLIYLFIFPNKIVNIHRSLTINSDDSVQHNHIVFWRSKTITNDQHIKILQTPEAQLGKHHKDARNWSLK